MTDDFGAIAELGGAAAVELAASALAERGAKPVKCKNCGAPVLADYCAVCGQERDTHRHTLWHLLHDVASELGSFDSRVLRTFFALLFQPGELPLAFREGRTRPYMPALRLYLFTSLLFFLVLSAAGIALFQIELQEVPNAYNVIALPNGRLEILSNGKLTPMPAIVAQKAHDKNLSPGSHSGLTTHVHFFEPIGRFHQRITPEGWARIAELKADVLKAVGNDKHGWMARNALAMVEKLARDPAALNGPFTTWIPRVFFLLLPLFALLLALFYWRQRRKFYFVDHLVFSLVFHSFVFALLIVAIGAAQLLAGGIVAELFFLAAGVYLLIAIRRFYGQGWVISLIKFAVTSFVYTVFFLMPALAFVLVTGIIEG
ncbi:MAG TPA: DUF3667 domain-containing protein [Rhizomicrobium sp.]|nr:DUF3667 domain-containing protein [Rhizomicrobium sp.]